MRSDQNSDRAKLLRQMSNKPEQRAWQTLRGLRKYGHTVRRQHPIADMIVDFAIVKARLAIEIDGSIHARDDEAARDAVRDARLVEKGWTVLRIPAHTALSADALLARVHLALREYSPLTLRSQTRPPSLSRERERDS